MGKNFMAAGTEISALVDKKEEVLIKIGNTIAEVLTNSDYHSVSPKQLDKDISNLTNDLTDSDKAEVYKQALIALTLFKGGKEKSKPYKESGIPNYLKNKSRF